MPGNTDEGGAEIARGQGTVFAQGIGRHSVVATTSCLPTMQQGVELGGYVWPPAPLPGYITLELTAAQDPNA